MATADAGAARLARAWLRAGMRLRARLGSGSVSAYMDRVVAEANSATVGSALSPELRTRRHRRDRRDSLPTSGPTGRSGDGAR